MKQKDKELIFATNQKKEFILLTLQIENFVSESKIKEGFCLINSLHATGAIIINENEEGLKEDILNSLTKLFPDDINYKHNIHDNNASAHIASILLGQNQTLIIRNGRLQRGTWQDIFFLELDGPRQGRKVLLKIIGD